MKRLSDVLQILESQSFPALVCDSERRITFANESLSELCGYSDEELIGQSPGRLLQGADTDPKTVADVREKLRASIPFGFSITNYHKDGHAYFVGVFVIPILAGDRSERFDIGICRELQSIDEKPLSRSVPAFNMTVGNVLDLVKSS